MPKKPKGLLPSKVRAPITNHFVQAMAFGEALSDDPCPRCFELAKARRLRVEPVQRLPLGLGVAPLARDGSGKCCFDCAFADRLVTSGMTFEMSRIAVANCRQEQYRLPGVRMGLVLNGMRVSKPGDLEDQHAWLNRHDWFGLMGEDTE